MSDIRVNTISNEAGTGPVELTKQSAAKAWAVANTAGSAIVNSMNVTSVTDLGNGLRTFTYTNAFSTATSAISVAPQSGGALFMMYYGILASSVNTMTEDSGTLRVDKDVSLTVHGDLA